ncbi:MAG TPA: hypothetical protein VFX24_13840 [Ktedonobacterales bacterium]|nr:hypothetical protein [Ktedonobacterales bacterium]
MSSGPTTIGPLTAVSGSVLSYTVPPETQAIYVQNYSKLTLLVSFAATAPTAMDSLNNQYDGVLAPGGRDTFYVQSRGASSAERSLNAMGAFTGNVWIMPVDRTSGLVNSGSISTNSDVWLSAYGPYDPPPPFPGGMPQNVDLSSQPRVVAVPIGLSHFYTNNWSLAAGHVPLISLLATWIPTPAQLAAGVCGMYVHYVWVDCAYNGTGSMSFPFDLEIQWRTSGGAAVGSAFVIARGTLVSATTSGDHWKLNPAAPLALVGQIPPTAAKVDVQINFSSGAVVAVGGTLGVVGFMDPTNVVGNAEIGVEPLLTGPALAAGYPNPVF